MSVHVISTADLSGGRRVDADAADAAAAVFDANEEESGFGDIPDCGENMTKRRSIMYANSSRTASNVIGVCPCTSLFLSSPTEWVLSNFAKDLSASLSSLNSRKA